MKTILSLVLLILAMPLAARDHAKEIDALVRDYSDAGRFNGTALVVEHGNVVYRRSFGYANFEWNVPNTADTKFRIGSITKSFTAILALQLAEQGKLNVERRTYPRSFNTHDSLGEADTRYGQGDRATRNRSSSIRRTQTQRRC